MASSFYVVCRKDVTEELYRMVDEKFDDLLLGAVQENDEWTDKFMVRGIPAGLSEPRQKEVSAFCHGFESCWSLWKDPEYERYTDPESTASGEVQGFERESPSTD